MLEQKVAEFFKGGKAQTYTPKFGLKRPDPVETGIKKLKAANVKPIPKGEMHVTAGLLGSEAFIAGFVDELAALEKEAGIISGIRKGLRTRLGTMAAGAALASAPWTAPPTAKVVGHTLYGAGAGALRGAGLTRPAMPKLPGEAEAVTQNVENEVARGTAKMKETQGNAKLKAALERKNAAQAAHDSAQKAPRFAGERALSRTIASSRFGRK
jgi:hypothetical protein